MMSQSLVGCKFKSLDGIKWRVSIFTAEFALGKFRIGEYIVVGDKFTLNSKCKSFINYATAIVNGIKN